MRAVSRPLLVIAVGLAAVVLVAGCGSSAGGSPSPIAPSASVGAPASAVTESPDAASIAPTVPVLTPVPGGQTVAPDPGSTRIPTTQTDWGLILDALPPSFPLYPGAEIAEVDGGPFSGTFQVATSPDVAAGWYRDAFSASGAGTELSKPLEDGSLVLDVQADLPECRIQMTFRPEDGSTIISALVASACANGTEG